MLARALSNPMSPHVRRMALMYPYNLPLSILALRELAHLDLLYHLMANPMPAAPSL